MRSRTLILLTALAAASAGTALAQSETAPAAAPVEGGAELVAKADAIVERLQSAVITIQRQLDVARSERNVVKVLFLSEKLSQANASLRSAVERRASLKRAVERGDAASAKQDAEVLAIIGERGDEYLNATSQAVGEATLMQDEAQVSVTTAPGTPTTTETSEFTSVDPVTGAADSNGRQASSQMGGGASSSSANDAPLANQNTLPDQPPIPASTSAR